ncbi:hypothetical protein ACLB2K_057045 [Fragaria x ananassa]
MAAAAQLRCSTLPKPHSSLSDHRRNPTTNLNSSISFPYSKTLNHKALSFGPKPNRDGRPDLSFSGGNGADRGGAGGGGGGGSGDWSRGDENEESKPSKSLFEGFGLLGMFLNGWRSRVAADPQFPFKVLMEEVVGVSSCVLGDMASRPNFGLNELDFVFSTLVVGCILNFTLMYLLAPSLSATAATLPSIFASCPASHMFEPGSFGLMSRLGTFVYKGAVFAGVGFAAGLAGTALSNGLIKLRKKMDPEFETPNKPPPTLLNAVTWAIHMGVSSNLRCLNNVLGGMTFVLLARLTGSQSAAEKLEIGSAAEKEKLLEESVDLQGNQSTYK